MARNLYTALLALALAGCASMPDGVQMTDAEAQACKASGCSVWTESELRELVAKVSAQARSSALENLDTHGCMRGRT